MCFWCSYRGRDISFNCYFPLILPILMFLISIWSTEPPLDLRNSTIWSVSTVQRDRQYTLCIPSCSMQRRPIYWEMESLFTHRYFNHQLPIILCIQCHYSLFTSWRHLLVRFRRESYGLHKKNTQYCWRGLPIRCRLSWLSATNCSLNTHQRRYFLLSTKRKESYPRRRTCGCMTEGYRVRCTMCTYPASFT